MLHLTTTAVLNIVDDISSKIDKQNITYLVLLDFSKAFDSLCHELLCKKLLNLYNFNINSVKLIQSYLENRKQIVYCGDNFSRPLDVPCGVPQGSILGPLLFSIFINDICSCISFSKFHLYADDLQVYHSSHFSKSLVLCDELNKDLSAIFTWSQVNGLSLNIDKTQAILISRTNSYFETRPLKLAGCTVRLAQSVVNLGFIIDKSLKWDKHVANLCGKVTGALQSLRRFHYLSQNMKLRLFKSLILPFFNYGDVLLFSMTSESRQRINKALNDCVRFVYNLRLGDHVTHLQASLIGCPMNKYYDYRAVVFIHRLISTRCPEYLHSRLRISISTRTRRLIPPINRTSFYNDSFFVRGVCIYNSIPNNIKAIVSLDSFRAECLRYFNS